MLYKKIPRGYVIIIGLALVVLCSYIKVQNSKVGEGFQEITDETACEYVSSRGILKSCDIHSSEPKSSTRVLKGYDFSKIVDGSIVYITASAIPAFVEIMKTIPHRIVLVTGDCDQSVYQDVFPSSHEFLEFIEQDKILHWFAQNSTVNHSKISPIPIGLDYHTLSEKSNSWGSQAKPMDQENLLRGIQDGSPLFYRRKISCYANFQFNINGRFANERRVARKEIPENVVEYEEQKRPREETWGIQSEYAFVISPSGNGLDCHRTWEALCLGCIPIVKSSPIDHLFEGLPVLIVNSWSDITRTKLEEVIDEFKNKTFNYDKLKLSYWTKQIRSFRDNALLMNPL